MEFTWDGHPTLYLCSSNHGLISASEESEKFAQQLQDMDAEWAPEEWDFD
jgi:hypothetical protein